MEKLAEKKKFNLDRAIVAEEKWQNVYNLEVKPIEAKSKNLEDERDGAIRKLATEEGNRKRHQQDATDARKAKVQSDKRVHAVHKELQEAAVQMGKTDELMAKVSKVAEQSHAKHKAAHAELQQECQSQLLWVQSRKPSFITEDQIYSAQSGSNACESTNDAAQQNWKQCNVKG